MIAMIAMIAMIVAPGSSCSVTPQQPAHASLHTGVMAGLKITNTPPLVPLFWIQF